MNEWIIFFRFDNGRIGFVPALAKRRAAGLEIETITGTEADALREAERFEELGVKPFVTKANDKEQLSFDFFGLGVVV